MKTTIYTRFSPRRNAEDSESCETQDALCRELAEKKCLSVEAVIHDPGASSADEYRGNSGSGVHWNLFMRKSQST